MNPNGAAAVRGWCVVLSMTIAAAGVFGSTAAQAGAAVEQVNDAHVAFDGIWRQFGRGRKPPGAPLGPCCSEQGWDAYEKMLQPWALEVMKKREAALVAGKPLPTNTAVCKPDGMPTVIDIPYPFRFLRTAATTYILYEADYQSRRIRMDSQHPAGLKPSWYGDSIGRWEGNVLVVDTVGLNAQGQLNWDGIPHTDALHVVERYSVPEPGQLLLEMTLTDPGALTGTWLVTKNFRLQRDPRLLEYVCAENNRDMGVPTE